MNTASTSTLNGSTHEYVSQPKARKARTTTAKPQAEQIHAASVKQSAFEKFMNAQQEMLEAWGAPTAKRSLAAFTTALIVSISIGVVGAFLVEAVTLAAIAFTGSTFIGLIVWVLGAALTVAIGFVVSAETYAYVVSKTIDRHAELVVAKVSSAKDYVFGLFGSK